MLEIKNNKCTKTFSNSKESARFVRLYNTFPNHINAKQNKNKLEYLFIEGKTFQEKLEKKEKIIEITKKISKTLSKIHFSNFEIIKDYQKICINRKYHPIKELFKKCYGYNTTIHGDLHTRNIIINNKEEIIFIDRLEEKGDLMFDFPIILSLTCFYLKTKNKIYIQAIDIFFKEYLKPLKDKNNFHIAFTNNYLNYLYLIIKTDFYEKIPFKEWEFAKEILKNLEKGILFKEYVEKLNLE